MKNIDICYQSFFEASNYKTNTVYQFYKLHLIINHIKEENIKIFFL